MQSRSCRNFAGLLYREVWARGLEFLHLAVHERVCEVSRVKYINDLDENIVRVEMHQAGLQIWMHGDFKDVAWRWTVYDY